MIALTLSGVPPSSNSLYSGSGRRFLSRKGKQYKNLIRIEILDQLVGRDLSWLHVGVRLCVTYTFVFTEQELLNKGWPKTAKSPHKRVDVSNRIKSVEDALFESLGIDDSQVFMVVAEKALGDEARTYIVIQPCN